MGALAAARRALPPQPGAVKKVYCTDVGPGAHVLPPEEVLADGAGMPLATADGGGGGALWGGPFLSMPAKAALVVIALAALRSALRKPILKVFYELARCAIYI